MGSWFFISELYRNYHCRNDGTVYCNKVRLGLLEFKYVIVVSISTIANIGAAHILLRGMPAVLIRPESELMRSGMTSSRSIRQR